MTTKMHLRPTDRDREPVRHGQLDIILERFNAEMGQKSAMLLTQYDKTHVAPLRRRVQWLELPWYLKALMRLIQAWRWVRSGKGRAWLAAKIRGPVPTPAAPSPPPAAEQPAPAEAPAAPTGPVLSE